MDASGVLNRETEMKPELEAVTLEDEQGEDGHLFTPNPNDPQFCKECGLLFVDHGDDAHAQDWHTVNGDGAVIRVVDAQGYTVTTVTGETRAERQRRADQIVREHNAHQPLVALAREIYNNGYISPVEDAVDMAGAALALVDGPQG
jgi:hypothetical protein